MTLYEGYEFYKSIQGTKYDKNDLVEPLANSTIIN